MGGAISKTPPDTFLPLPTYREDVELRLREGNDLHRIGSETEHEHREQRSGGAKVENPFGLGKYFRHAGRLPVVVGGRLSMSSMSARTRREASEVGNEGEALSTLPGHADASYIRSADSGWGRALHGLI